MPIDWPTHPVRATDLGSVYSRGFQGYIEDPAAEEELLDGLEFADFGEAADAEDCWADSHGVAEEEGLYLPFLAQIKLFARKKRIRGSFAELSADDRVSPWAESQTTGDCVSHFARNLAALINSVEIFTLGEPEDWQPQATEPAYGARGHSGAGASCHRLLKFFTADSGCFSRGLHQIPDFGDLDLTKYNARIGIDWGRRGTPDAVKRWGQTHRVARMARCNTREEIVNAFRNNLAAGGCSGMGFSSRRDGDGVATPRGSWAHAMCWTGLDIRESTQRKYGNSGLVLIQNSWGSAWQGGGRRIRGTDILIPKGSFWASFDHVLKNAGGFFCMAGVSGWSLPDIQDFGNRW